MEIIYEDNHLLVVVKPPGVLSQGDITNDIDMLTILKNYIKEKYQKPGNVYLGLVHRLDRMVGGLMVFAKTSKAASRINEQIRNHKFIKNYLAVVHGKVKANDKLIHYLYKDHKKNIVQVKDKPYKDAKKAELTYQLINSKNNFSLVDINLITGRPHQIRAQFAYINHPLLGDKKYGINDNVNMIALFAYKLSFYHPTSKEHMSFSVKPTNYPFTLFNI